MKMGLNESMQVKQSQSGQVGIIVLLIMVVMVTVGVSVASRSVTELKLSRQEEQSTRALDLAEGGAETILANLGAYTGGVSPELRINNQKIDYTVTSENVIENMTIHQGHTLQINLIDAPANQLKISWSDSVVNCNTTLGTPALVVAIINENYEVRREFYGPTDCIIARNDNATPVNRSDDGVYAIPLITIDGSRDVMARIKAVYNQAVVSVSGNGDGLPTQVDVVSTSFTDTDGTTRAVTVNRLAGSLPSIFDYVLFSGTSLEKN